MIPKIIHYSWIGDKPYSDKIVHNIESWKKFLPDYTFMKWDKTTFDFNICKYVKDALDSENYAHASDFIRVWALYNYGGFWLDIDVEVFQSFNSLLKLPYMLTKEIVCPQNGFVEMGVMGFEPHSLLMRMMVNFYKHKEFKYSLDEIIPKYFRDECRKHNIRICEVNPLFNSDADFTKLNTMMRQNRTTLYTLDKFVYFHKTGAAAYAQHYYYNTWVRKEGDET